MGLAARQSGVAGGDRVASAVRSGGAPARTPRRADRDHRRGLPPVLRGRRRRARRDRPPAQLDAPGRARGDARRDATRLGWRPDEFVCLHGGNMGQKQGLDNLLDAAALLADDADPGRARGRRKRPAPTRADEVRGRRLGERRVHPDAGAPAAGRRRCRQPTCCSSTSARRWRTCRSPRSSRRTSPPGARSSPRCPPTARRHARSRGGRGVRRPAGGSGRPSRHDRRLAERSRRGVRARRPGPRLCRDTPFRRGEPRATRGIRIGRGLPNDPDVAGCRQPTVSARAAGATARRSPRASPQDRRSTRCGRRCGSSPRTSSRALAGDLLAERSPRAPTRC